MAIATINPATGETLRTFELFTDEQVDRVLQRASDTWRQYRRTTWVQRAEWMERAAQILETRKDA